MSVDVSVWRADIERQMAEGGPVYIVGEGVYAGRVLVTESQRYLPLDDGPWLQPVGWPSPNETTPCPNDCARFGGKVPGHVYGSNWDWVPCQTCGGSGVTAGTRTELQVKWEGQIVLVGDEHEFAVTGGDDNGLSQLDEHGTVLWATATWQTLPVVNRPNNEDGSGLPAVWILIEGHVMLVQSGTDHHYLPQLAGSVRPGMWAAVLTGIELATSRR